MSVFANKVSCSFSGKKLGFTLCCNVGGWYFKFITKVISVWNSIVWKVLVCANVFQNNRVRRMNRLSMTVLSASGAWLYAPDGVERLLRCQRCFLLTRKSCEYWRRFGLTGQEQLFAVEVWVHLEADVLAVSHEVVTLLLFVCFCQNKHWASTCSDVLNSSSYCVGLIVSGESVAQIGD